jgi:hypothetical protein
MTTFIAGGIASCIAEALTLPIDTIKVFEKHISCAYHTIHASLHIY